MNKERINKIKTDRQKPLIKAIKNGTQDKTSDEQPSRAGFTGFLRRTVGG